MTPATETVLQALRGSAEDRSAGWSEVYLDNASHDAKMAPHVFAGHLAVLEKEGLYRPIDNFAWGQVRMERAVDDDDDEPLIQKGTL